jgi:molybdate transport system substrate-binding protein
MWVRKDLGLDPNKDGLKVLLNPAVKHVAIGNPAIAPFGRSAEAALKASSLLDAVKPKLVLGENITQAAQYLQTGAAEAGFISSPQALAPALSSGFAWTVPQSLYPVQKQAGVILKRTTQPKLASDFQAFLLSPETQGILARLGYGAP